MAGSCLPLVIRATGGMISLQEIHRESSDAVRLRIGENWDVDIYKSMILAVEEDSWANVIT